MLIVAGVAAATAVSALVGTFAETPDQAGPWLSTVAVVLGMLGGAFFPVVQAGGLLETASLATPHAWGNEAFTKLREQGAGLGDVLRELGVLLLFAGAMISVATIRLRRVLTR